VPFLDVSFAASGLHYTVRLVLDGYQPLEGFLFEDFEAEEVLRNFGLHDPR
jgi:hypothetical protein